jgi:uncharacterized protein DUF1996
MPAASRRALRCLPVILAVVGSVSALAAKPIVIPGLEGPFAGGNFVVDCGFARRLDDDPIVSPDVPGASHDHSFFGNETTNAFSTAETLVVGQTLCHRRQDRSAYWVPTMLVNGRPVTPLGAAIYYRRGTYAEVHVPPNGLRMIAGDQRSMSPQAADHVYWNCEAQGVATTEVPVCPLDPRYSLRLHVDFPECWDGVNLDSPDHVSHLAYATEGECPASHPVPIPSLRLVVRFPVGGVQSLALSSGSINSGHADVFFAWRGKQLKRLVRRCLNGRHQCSRKDDGPQVRVSGQ